MNKKSKKIGRPLLLALILSVASITTVRAYTDNQIITIGQHTYKVVSAADFTLCFLSTTATGNLIIPSTVDDGTDTHFTVTAVGGNSEYRSPGVTTVTIPEGVTTISTPSFAGARLTSIHLPSTLATYEHETGFEWLSAPVFTVDQNNPHFATDEQGALYSKDMKSLYSVPSTVALDSNGAYTVNETVENIFQDAFLRNYSLKKIVLPPNLQSIELGFPTITYGNESLQEFEVATGGNTPFRTIDGVLFHANTLVDYPRGKTTTDYRVPDGITAIAPYGINDCQNLQNIDLNDIVNLNNASISNCPRLTSITLPRNLEATASMEGCFVGCYRVAQYIVPEGSANFTEADGVVYSKDMKTLYFYPPARQGTTYDIPESVTKISTYAFRRAQNIETIQIPKNVTEIGLHAFRGMPNLTTFTFAEPSTIRTFGSNILMECPKLREVTLPTSLTYIDNAFARCYALEVINIPDGSQLTTIQGSAFVTNTALRQFNFLGSSQLLTIGSNAFANLTKLQTFDVPKTVTDISANAFTGCSSLATVTFDDDAAIRNIRTGAFADCGLTTVTIPPSVTTIEKEAFRNCEVLTAVNLSANVTNVSPEAFKHCRNLDNITVDKDNTVYSSLDGYLLTADKETLVLFPPGKANSKFTLLPPSITKIGDYAFYDCSKLENVIIPNKVAAIGKRAFGLCTNLNTITFLSDEVIDPANIDQEPNSMSFDDGTNVAPDMFPNIDTYVRPHLQAAFQSLPYYQKFRIVGTSFLQDGNEYLPVSDNAVSLLAAGNRDYTFVVPTETTTDNPKNLQYNVALIGDYAFQNTTASVHEVVVKNNVEYIGAKAFMTDIDTGSSTIEKVFFIQPNPTSRMLATTRFELDETGNNYNEFAATTNIYVKKTSLDTYRQAWTKTTYDRATHTYQPSPFDFTSQLDYRIPGADIKTKYATFSREFDTDFSDYLAENSNAEIAAFVAAETGFLQGHGDYGNSEYRIRMSSIDENGGYSSQAYVPANTGVLLKVLDLDATPQDFYYTIGEQDDQTYTVTGNIMTGVNINPATNVAATESEPIYVMQGGVFRPITSTLANFPIHKAYMKVGPLPSGAKVVITFDDNSTTGIESLTPDHSTKGEESKYVYDLQGRKVSAHPSSKKGIYIYKGKKIVVK